MVNEMKGGTEQNAEELKKGAGRMCREEQGQGQEL